MRHTTTGRLTVILYLFLLLSSFQEIDSRKILVPFGRGGGAYKITSALADVLTDCGVEEWDPVSQGNLDSDLVSYLIHNPKPLPLLIHNEDLISAMVRDPVLEWEVNELFVPLVVLQNIESELFVRTIDSHLLDEGFLTYCAEHPCKVAVYGDALGGESRNLKLWAEKSREGGRDLKLVPLTFANPVERYIALVKGEVHALVEQPGDVGLFLMEDLFHSNYVFEETKNYLPRMRILFAPRHLGSDELERLEDLFRAAYETATFRAFLRRGNPRVNTPVFYGRKQTQYMVQKLITWFRTREGVAF